MLLMKWNELIPSRKGLSLLSLVITSSRTCQMLRIKVICWRAGPRLLSGSMDKTLIVWETNEEMGGLWMEKVRVGDVGGHSLGFLTARFSPSADSILAQAYQGAFHRWVLLRVCSSFYFDSLRPYPRILPRAGASRIVPCCLIWCDCHVTGMRQARDIPREIFPNCAPSAEWDGMNPRSEKVSHVFSRAAGEPRERRRTLTLARIAGCQIHLTPTNEAAGCTCGCWRTRAFVPASRREVRSTACRIGHLPYRRYMTLELWNRWVVCSLVLGPSDISMIPLLSMLAIWANTLQSKY